MTPRQIKKEQKEGKEEALSKLSLNLGSRKAIKGRRRINAQVDKVLRMKKDQSENDGSRGTCAISTKDCRLVHVICVCSA